MTKKKPEMEIDPSLIDEAVASVEKRTKGKEGESETPPAAPEAGSPEESPESLGSDDTYDKLIRLTADFENFRKRVQKEKSDLVLYGNEKLARELLPVVDNFERATEHVEKSSDVDSLRQGVEMVFSQLKGVLDKFGIRAESAVGKVFDPLVHEAVSHIPSPDQPPNKVIEEHQKAYFLHKRLLRPALVTVSKGPEGTEIDSNLEETPEGNGSDNDDGNLN